MKKKLILGVLVSVMAASGIYGLAACNSPEEVDVAERYETVINENPYENYISFYDDNYDFYMFDLGTIFDVPLQDDVDNFKYEGNAFEYDFTSSQTTTTTVETSVKKAITHTATDWTKKWVSGGGGVSIEWGIAKFKAHIEGGYENNTTITDTTTSTESYKRAASYSETNTKTIKISFNENFRHGYYRYILMGEVKVYATVIIDRDSNEIYIDNYSVVKSQYYNLDYCATSSSFDDNKYQQFPELDLERVKNLPAPETRLEGNFDFAGGDGSEGSPFLLAEPYQFCNIYLYPNKYFKLSDDIEMDYNFSTVNIEDFRGVLDGNNHSITFSATVINDKGNGGQIVPKALSAEQSNGDANMVLGLFKSNSGTIKNLNIVNSQLTYISDISNEVTMGMIAGVNYGTIENCTVKDSVLEVSIGDGDSGTDCRSVTLGGIAGVNYGTVKDSFVTLSNIKVTVERWCSDVGVNNKDIGIEYVGGIVGKAASGGSVTDCNVNHMREIRLGFRGGMTNTGNSPVSQPKITLYSGGIIGVLDNGATESNNGSDMLTDSEVFVFNIFRLPSTGADNIVKISGALVGKDMN